MDAKDYLDLARKLAQMRTEAALRSAISRSYYAAFHFCRNLVESLGFPFECQKDPLQATGIIMFRESYALEPLRAALKKGLSDCVQKTGSSS
jgi:hypothetical protein